MIDLSDADRAKVDDAAARLAAAGEDRLIGLALYGEIASTDYRPGRSPLSMVAILRDVTAEALERLRPAVVRLARRGLPTPLVVDADYLDRARDVFPLELLELRDRHRPLRGDVVALAEITIDLACLRRQVEAELRGKMLHLWENYLTAPTRRRLRRELLGTVPYFLHVLRGLLELKASRKVDDGSGVVVAIEREYGITLPVLTRLERSHRDGERIALSAVDGLFSEYVEETRGLARLADRL